jgi:hypothetical protein
MNKDQEAISKKMTFTEFSESCRSRFAETMSGVRDHTGVSLPNKAQIKQQLKKFERQIKSHKDVLDR